MANPPSASVIGAGTTVSSGYPIFVSQDSNGTQVMPVGNYVWTGSLWLAAAGDSNGNQQMILSGSNAIYGYQVTSQQLAGTQGEQTLVLPKTTRHVNIINDGAIDTYLGFNEPTAAKVDDLDASWAYVGSWSSLAESRAFGGYVHATTDSPTGTGDTASWNPGTTVQSIGFIAITGVNAGIANILLSTDGATWVQPSTIAGIVRSDGATGSALDTVDLYQAMGGIIQLNFLMPNSGTWQLQVQSSGTKNASSGSTNIYVDGGLYTVPGKPLVIKGGEVKDMQFELSTIYYWAWGNGASPLRIEADV